MSELHADGEALYSHAKRASAMFIMALKTAGDYDDYTLEYYRNLIEVITVLSYSEPITDMLILENAKNTGA